MVRFYVGWTTLATLLRMNFMGDPLRQGGKARGDEDLNQAVLPGKERTHSGGVLEVKLIGLDDRESRGRTSRFLASEGGSMGYVECCGHTQALPEVVSILPQAGLSCPLSSLLTLHKSSLYFLPRSLRNPLNLFQSILHIAAKVTFQGQPNENLQWFPIA